MGNKSGFNIIELVVVVVIIGILASLAIPQYNKTIERSRQAEAYTNLAAIRGAQLRYYLENVSWGSAIASLDIDNPDDNDSTSKNYFNYYVVASSDTVASAVRNSGTGYENPGYGTYTITISSAGATGKFGGNNPP